MHTRGGDDIVTAKIRTLTLELDHPPYRGLLPQTLLPQPHIPLRPLLIRLPALALSLDRLGELTPVLVHNHDPSCITILSLDRLGELTDSQHELYETPKANPDPDPNPDPNHVVVNISKLTLPPQP